MVNLNILNTKPYWTFPTHYGWENLWKEYKGMKEIFAIFAFLTSISIFNISRVGGVVKSTFPKVFWGLWVGICIYHCLSNYIIKLYYLTILLYLTILSNTIIWYPPWDSNPNEAAKSWTSSIWPKIFENLLFYLSMKFSDFMINSLILG